MKNLIFLTAFLMLTGGTMSAEEKTEAPELTEQEQSSIQLDVKDIQLLLKEIEIHKLQIAVIENQIGKVNQSLAAKVAAILKAKGLDPQQYSVNQNDKTGKFSIVKKEAQQEK